jgi:Zn-finger protein
MNLNETLTDLVRKIVHIRDKNCNCIICNKPFIPGQNLEVAHYIKRRHKSLTWDLVNVNLSHFSCNREEENNESFQAKHTINMLEKYGNNEVMRLHNDKNKTVHLYKCDKEDKILEFHKLLKSLKK